MFDESFNASGSSVVTIGRASVARERVAFPAGGHHAVSLPVRLQLALRAERDRVGLAPSGIARNAVLAAAGLGARPANATRSAERHPVRPRCVVTLSREERAAVDEARRGRDLSAWLREAIGAAVGWHGRWAPCADAFLRMNFRRLDAAEIRRALPGRTPETIYEHAQQLGLSVDLGAYEDRMSLHAAAEAAGYHRGTLLRILRAAGVAPRRLAGDTNDPAREHLFVTRRDLKRAVDAWAEGESLLSAADRLGCDGSDLAAHLRARGHAPTNGRSWHLPSKVYDEVVAAWRRGEGPRLGPGQGAGPKTCAACGARHYRRDPCGPEGRPA